MMAMLLVSSPVILVMGVISAWVTTARQAQLMWCGPAEHAPFIGAKCRLTIHWHSPAPTSKLHVSSATSTFFHCRGFTSNVVTIAYYGAPLSTMFTVIRSRSSASIYLPMCLANLVNTLLWIGYGFVRFCVRVLFCCCP